ncbi:MAG: hypothetical protein U0263_15415 [Polyangiaceae bacterium]
MLRRLLFCLVLALAAVTTRPVVAKPAPAAEAKQSDKAGQKLERQKKWQEAKVAYEKSLELDEKPDVRLRLAAVESKLGHLLEAAEHVKRVLDAPKLAFMTRAKAKNLKKSLEKRTPKLTLDLPPGFSGTVSIDGKDIASGELGSPILVNPGNRQVRAESKGSKPFEENVELAEKDQKTLSVRLEELPKAEAARPVKPPQAEKSSGGSKTLAYVSLGVGVVGLGVGTYMGLKAKSTKSDIDQQCKNGVCSESQRDLYDRGKTQANISTAGFIVGGVGIGLGTVLLLTGGKSTEAKASARHATPYLGPGEVGVAGAF